jgi:F-type H+-transporting ATPase subunit delta
VHALADQLDLLAQVTSLPELRRFADEPGTARSAVEVVVTGAIGSDVLAPVVRRLLHVVVSNRRLAALPAIAGQYRALVDAATGVHDATIYSPFPIDDGHLAHVVTTLEQRFDRKLQARVAVQPDLIGGIRVVVGDEVLDTSVKARLEQMKVALTA